MPLMQGELNKRSYLTSIFAAHQGVRILGEQGEIAQQCTVLYSK